MARRTYGQHCGIARGLELTGERWAMLIVRELLLTPKRYTDLQQRLPGIPTNVLASRLRELESAGVVERTVAPRPASGVLYDLTPYGRELEDVLLRFWRWGIGALPSEQESGRTPTDPAIRALQAAFRPDEAEGFRADYEIWFGTFVMHARVDNGQLEAGAGALESFDLRIDCRGAMTPLLRGDVSPAEAIDSGRFWIDGDKDLLDRFARVFRIPPGD